MNTIQRLAAPTPKFFKVIRNGGLLLATLGGSLLAAPITLPAVVLKWAAYFAVAGGVAATVSQATTQDPAVKEDPNAAKSA